VAEAACEVVERRRQTPGQCLSDQAYWQVKQRLDLNVSDLVSQSLKNIAETMRAFSREGSCQPIARSPSTGTMSGRTGQRPTIFNCVAARRRIGVLNAGLAFDPNFEAVLDLVID
jgi:hypothetical protein